MRKLFSRTEAYDKVHFAVMAIENGAQIFRTFAAQSAVTHKIIANN